MKLESASRQAHAEELHDGRSREPKSHQWECKYQVVFIPKCRRKTLYQRLRRHLGEVIAATGAAQGKSDRRRASDARPRPYDDRDTAEGTRCRMWWGTSRGRARFTCHECTESGAGISLASTFGPEDTLSRRSEETRR
jgi:hypothetical protein